MKAYIRLNNQGQAVEINVKSRSIDGIGLVRIVDEYGIVYETHLCQTERTRPMQDLTFYRL